MKAEEQSNPITNFFSKKGTDGNKQSSKTIKTSTKDSTKNDPQSDVKEEAEAQANVEPSCSGRTVTETRSDVSTISPGSDSKVDLKRDYEKFLDDSKPRTAELGKVSQTPVKKSKVKSGAEKQATLRSYFTKS